MTTRLPMPDLAPRTSSSLLPGRPFAPGRDGLIRGHTPRFTDIRPLRLEDFLSGAPRRRDAFARALVEQLSERGFFYLERPAALLARHELEGSFERYEATYQHALLAHPYLHALMPAESVFQTGYNATWFPESTVVRQAIEAFMAKPATWNAFRRRLVPEPVRELLGASEEAYLACHEVGSVLLEALEHGYGLRAGGLTRLFRRRTEGAVRFVKYHAPSVARRRREVVAHASEPHADKSFFTFNLGESRPGLVWLDRGVPRLLPNDAGHWLITSGQFSEGLTRELDAPVRAFRHTVVNDGERVVVLGFVTPEGDLHDLPLDEWPAPTRMGGPRG
ncbi:hypothetical protein G4177_12165 [Corallococcus sp. ZKHCc1 1396]|uniref:Isopenicillin N synthase family oxygenase n=1 Tax=Corallococcus soli TaxID=2710757 RepID=A0ABR9PLW8_9BACT|nr:hypothetical protein [Corallococcus soli]MBE4748916.1 hypothetical protein [Corallococcus soli]